MGLKSEDITLAGTSCSWATNDYLWVPELVRTDQRNVFPGRQKASKSSVKFLFSHLLPSNHFLCFSNAIKYLILRLVRTEAKFITLRMEIKRSLKLLPISLETCQNLALDVETCQNRTRKF